MSAPDCPLCSGPVRLEGDHDGAAEVCTVCTYTRPLTGVLPDRRQVRAQVRAVRDARPVLCTPCLSRSCRTCVDPGCSCLGLHPRRPVGEVTAEGLALLAAETQGHLTPAEVAA